MRLHLREKTKVRNRPLMGGFLTFLVERGLAAQRTALLLEEGAEHHHASETLAPLVPAPYSPRRWCLCHAAPLERRLKLWLLTKYLFSQVREPAALPQGSCPNTRQPPLLQCHFHQPSTLGTSQTPSQTKHA